MEEWQSKVSSRVYPALGLCLALSRQQEKSTLEQHLGDRFQLFLWCSATSEVFMPADPVTPPYWLCSIEFPAEEEQIPGGM